VILTKKRFKGYPIMSPPFPVEGGAHDFEHNDVVTSGAMRRTMLRAMQHKATACASLEKKGSVSKMRVSVTVSLK
jgi:hypothetical protein